MLQEKFIKNLKRAGLLFSLAIGFLVLTGIEAKAQYNRNDDDYYRNERRDRRDRRDNRRDDRRNRDNNNDDYYRNNNGYYNNGYGYITRIARENGYRDGFNKGMEEYREGDRYNPEGTRPYKNGLSGYDRSMGSKEQYRQIYRQAFLQGFRQGYSQNRNRNRRWGY